MTNRPPSVASLQRFGARLAARRTNAQHRWTKTSFGRQMSLSLCRKGKAAGEFPEHKGKAGKIMGRWTCGQLQFCAPALSVVFR